MADSAGAGLPGGQAAPRSRRIAARNRPPAELPCDDARSFVTSEGMGVALRSPVPGYGIGGTVPLGEAGGRVVRGFGLGRGATGSGMSVFLLQAQRPPWVTADA